MKMKILSVVVPCYNEQEALPYFYEEIKKVRGLGCPRKCPRHIYIDNKKLDEFIQFFIENKCTGNCNSCGYCNMIAKKAIKKNDEVCNYLLELYNKYDKVKM